MSISLQSIHFHWSNGQELFNNLKLTLDGNQKHGLVGSNGVGKTTLIKIILGQEVPAKGHVIVTSKISVFQQREEPPHILVSEYLEDVWSTIFDEERQLINSFLETIDLSKFCSELSGGQWTKCRLLKIILEPSTFIIFDEPTNHLDLISKNAIIEFLKNSKKGVLLISHDRELLKHVDHIHELSNLGISTYGGDWTHYEKARELENERFAFEYAKAQRDKKKAQAEQQQKLEKQEKRMRAGKKYGDSGSGPKILLNRNKRMAENTLGRVQRVTAKINEKYLETLKEVHKTQKVDLKMYAQLNQPQLRGAKIILETQHLNFMIKNAKTKLWKQDLNLVLRGAEKLAIVGSNGVGKSTLIKAISGKTEDYYTLMGHLRLGNIKSVYIDQLHLSLSKEKSILENISGVSDLPLEDIRNQLAMFLFQDSKVDQTIESLSGGELLRVSLAMALIQKNPPELIVLDEPTNNLDIQNINFLETLLKEYKGAVIVVSHDTYFLEKMGITQTLNLDL